MKRFFSNIQTIVILVLIILVLMKTCEGPAKPIEKIVTKIEVRYDTLEVEKKVYIPKYQTRIVTKVDTFTINKKIDTLAILKDYYAKYVYQDTLKLDTLGYVVINDTITQNKIYSRSFDNSQILIPTTTITNDIYLNQRKFFGGVSLGGNSSQINFLSGDLLYKTKTDNIYGIGLGVNQNLQPIVIGRLYWKLGKK